MKRFVLGPEITVEQLQQAKRFLEGSAAGHSESFPFAMPATPDERAAFLEIINDVIAEVAP